ncbi:MAG TPA: hypothetical protein VNU75_13880 [Acidimicrobiales bacterium]|nr:hypothetical protein [Acidimicrobiales bacterium]
MASKTIVEGASAAVDAVATAWPAGSVLNASINFAQARMLSNSNIVTFIPVPLPGSGPNSGSV